MAVVCYVLFLGVGNTMSEQNAPTCPPCSDCGGDHITRMTWPCIRSMAARIASLEAVVKQMGPQGAESAPESTPVAPGARWSPSSGYRCMFEAANQQCNQDATRCYRVNQRGFQCCDKHRPAPESTPAPNHRTRHRIGYAAMDSRCWYCTAEAGEPCRDDRRNPPESTPDVLGSPCSSMNCSAWVGPDETKCGLGHVQVAAPPIPPRPEGQVTVTHDDARRAVNELRSFHGASTGPMPKDFALLDRYRTEQAARDKAQADEIGVLREQRDGANAWFRRSEEEVKQLRAELAALKQPVPVAADAEDEKRARLPMSVKRMTTTTSPKDGTGNRITACIESLCKVGDGYTEHDHKCDRLKRLLDAAEQRGRASRDGVVKAEAWRGVDGPMRTVVLNRFSVEADNGWSVGEVKAFEAAARALESLAKDGDK